MNASPLRNLGIKFDAVDSARIAEFESATGIQAVDLGRNAIRAALTYFEVHNSISFPLSIVPAGTFKMPTSASHGLNEEADPEPDRTPRVAGKQAPRKRP